MTNPLREIVAEGITGIIRSLPDEAKVILKVEDLTREKFDELRGDQEATYFRRAGVWNAVIPFGSGVFLEIETRDNPSLKAVS